MKYCSKCGNELLDEAVICPKCGCPVPDMKTPRQGSKKGIVFGTILTVWSGMLALVAGAAFIGYASNGEFHASNLALLIISLVLIFIGVSLIRGKKIGVPFKKLQGAVFKSKKSLAVVGVITVVVIAIAFVFLHKSKFEKVKDECVQIAGQVTGSGDYFTLDTNPYEDMDKDIAALLLPGTQENTLEAIRYANEELGFNGSLYSKMINTTVLMGRQSEENDKYKVSWTYNPDHGLEVTYDKK